MSNDRMPVGAAMLEEHARLQRLFIELLEAAHAGVDKRTLLETWRDFEHGLSAHLDTEDLILPRYRAAHPDEVAEAEAVHRRLRALLFEVGILIDLGMVREPAVLELVELIRAHAEREERGLYAWADQAMVAGDPMAMA